MNACALFGHRDSPSDIFEDLCKQIEKLYLEKSITKFYVGHQGQFDSLARKAILFMKCVYPDIQCIVTLAYFPTPGRLPELQENEMTYFPEGIETVPPRFAIDYRNRWMADNCDSIICYIEHSFGGAAKYVERAKKKGKQIINLYTFSNDKTLIP